MVFFYSLHRSKKIILKNDLYLFNWLKKDRMKKSFCSFVNQRKINCKKETYSFQLSKNDRLKNVFFPISNQRKIDWEMISTHFDTKKRSIEEWLLFVSSIKQRFPPVQRSKINRLKKDLYPFHQSNIFNEQKMIDYWMISPPFINQRATDLKIVPYHFIYQKWWFEDSFQCILLSKEFPSFYLIKKIEWIKVSIHSSLKERLIKRRNSIQFIVKEQSNEEW